MSLHANTKGGCDRFTVGLALFFELGKTHAGQIAVNFRQQRVLEAGLQTVDVGDRLGSFPQSGQIHCMPSEPACLDNCRFLLANRADVPAMLFVLIARTSGEIARGTLSL